MKKQKINELHKILKKDPYIIQNILHVVDKRTF